MQSGIDNNIIITEPSKNLRTLGRNALAGNWKIAILAVIVYTLILQVPQDILNSLFGVNMSYMYGDDYYYGMDAGLYSDLYSAMPRVSPLSSLYMILVGGPLELGLSLFFLALFRRQLVEVSDIFLGFEKFGKALGLFVYMSLFIFLWMLLFIIPGIIAAIRYSQAFYILADDPEKGIRQCMDESKAMMKGNKMKYFCLSISFIGWLFLASIPASLITTVGDAVGSGGFVSGIFAIIGGLMLVPVMVYMNTTFAGFYEILAGHLIKATEPAPVDPVDVPLPESLQAPAGVAAEFESVEQAAEAEAPEAAPEAAPAAEAPEVDVPQAEAEAPAVPEAAESELTLTPEDPAAPFGDEIPETPVAPELTLTPEDLAAPEAPAEAEAPSVFDIPGKSE